MLQFHHRFHGHGSLRFVYAHGKAVRSSLIVVKSSHNPRRKHSRFAVVVSKKVMKSAVRRNRIRRRVYEIIRQELPRLHAGRDVACIIVSGEVLTMPHEALQAAVQQLFSQASLYK
ncbi:MAG: ribonuclease P protein component [Candidatus Saccharibacteria bacterium]|nr:ribonuclease P protein component [Candidatus Saccharibacteria bacterium]